METFSPKVTIELSEYNHLKDLEYQFKFLTDNVKIEEQMSVNPLTPMSPIKYKFGIIERCKLDFFYKNLLDIEKLKIIERGED